MSRNVEVHFLSETPIENIEAHNNQVSALFDSTTGEIVFQVPIRGFHFEKALMEEHFNENYIESHQYPKTSFKGSITDFDKNTLSDQPQTVELAGELSIHGVTKAITVPANVTQTDELITLASSFSVKTSDFGIEIPSLVRKQIDENVQIKVSLPLKPK